MSGSAVIKELLFEHDDYRGVVERTAALLERDAPEAWVWECRAIALFRLRQDRACIATATAGLAWFPRSAALARQLVQACVRARLFDAGIAAFHTHAAGLAGDRKDLAMALSLTIASYILAKRPAASALADLAPVLRSFGADSLDDCECEHLAKNLAGLYALAGDTKTALRFVAKALAVGAGPDYFRRDADFDGIRQDDEFRRMVG